MSDYNHKSVVYSFHINVDSFSRNLTNLMFCVLQSKLWKKLKFLCYTMSGDEDGDFIYKTEKTYELILQISSNKNY